MIREQDRATVSHWLAVADTHRAFVLSVHMQDGHQDARSAALDRAVTAFEQLLARDRKRHSPRQATAMMAAAMAHGDEAASTALESARVVMAGDPADVRSS